ncbi:MAG TPA: alkaline phosphatase family protein [Candidatus Acidoferrales bacterium]|nr:alkaline phosphatase family protein [Candidatus Acidoferrales bacterium]
MLTQKLNQPATPEGFVYPQYKANCISNIPNTILQLLQTKGQSSPLIERLKLDTKNLNKVVLLVVDGFGFNKFLNHHKQNPFLTNLTNKGQVFPITSVYPSQTTNALTTLNTGLTPQEHGLFEYFIYLKETGIINALRFERIGTKTKTKLIEQGFDPHLMFNGENIQQKLVKEGIKTFTHMNNANAHNICTKLVFEGSTIVPSYKTSDAIVKLRKNIEKNSGAAYFFVHLETLDTISHDYGPQSEEVNAELQTISYLLQKELVEKLSPQAAKETLLLVTADHGGVQVNPEETTYLSLNSESILNAEIGKGHKKILPTGSPRDIFLHVKEEKLAATKEALSKSIGEKAQIIETKAALKAGLFGLGEPKQDFLERTGNLLVMPYGKETMWFEHRSGRKINLLGQHGGLNPDEMLVPFAAAKLDDLKKS